MDAIRMPLALSLCLALAVAGTAAAEEEDEGLAPPPLVDVTPEAEDAPPPATDEPGEDEAAPGTVLDETATDPASPAAEEEPSVLERTDPDALRRTVADPELLDLLLALVDPDEPDRRSDAAATLADPPRADAEGPLLYVLRDGHPEVRRSVIETLGAYPSPRVAAALADRIARGGELQDLRIAATSALGRHRTDDAADRLAAAVTDEGLPRPVREAASASLQTHFPDRAVVLAPPPLDRTGRVPLGVASAAFGGHALYSVGALGRSDAGAAIGLLGGLPVGAATAYLLTQENEITLTQAAWVTTLGGWGIASGRMAGDALTPTFERSRFGPRVGGLLGQAAGLSAAAYTLRQDRYDLGQIGLINVWGGAGALMGWGLDLQLDPFGSPRRTSALGLAGSGAGLAAAFAAATHVPRGMRQSELDILTAAELAWFGAWLPFALDANHLDRRAPGGLLLGLGSGFFAGRALGLVVTPEARQVETTFTFSAYGRLLGAGLPLLFGVEGPPVARVMLGAQVVSLVAAPSLMPHLDLQSPRGLLVLGTVLGGWHGVAIPVWLDVTGRASLTGAQLTGGWLAGMGLGGAAGLALSQALTLSSWEVLMQSAGAFWGLWFSFWGGLLADLPGEDMLLLTLISADVGFATAAILVSPWVGVHPTRLGIASVGGLSGAALFSLVAALATPDGDAINRANIAGSILGLAGGALFAARLDLEAPAAVGLSGGRFEIPTPVLGSAVAHDGTPLMTLGVALR